MPNANRPSGFTPRQYLNGAPWSGQTRLYSIAASYGTALYIGDPVISSGTADAKGVPGVILGAATGALRGVIVGLGKTPGGLFNPSNLDVTFRPASDPSVWYAAVVDDPNVLFEIQEESNGTALAATEIGLNTVPVIAAGNGFVSGWQLRSATGATPATTATLQLRLMGLVQYPQDNDFGAFAKHLVKINVHELGSGTGAAGV
jgi:hypothetical protein